MSKVLAVAAIQALVSAQDVDNAEYKSWSGSKVGTAVKSKMVSEAMGNKTEMDQVVTLVELTADKAVIETVMTMMGNAMPGQKREIPAKVKSAPAGDAKGVKPVEGDEEIEVAGKKVKCHWVETTSDANGMKTVSRIWQSKDIPGGMAKMVSNSTGSMTSSTTLTVVEIK